MDMSSTSKEPNPRRALGRGLAALIPTVTVATNAGLRNLAIERLRPSRGQPRKHFDVFLQSAYRHCVGFVLLEGRGSDHHVCERFYLCIATEFNPIQPGR